MADPSKKEVVREMFDEISPRYDFLNHFLSFGIDRNWRTKVVRIIKMNGSRQILDVATGTGDLAIAVARTGPEKITGIDISEKMLGVGRKKITGKSLNHIITLQQGDAENIPHPDNSFDAVTVAFGVRNFENLEKGLAEMRRVLRPGGLMLILEFSHPQHFPMKQLYRLYSRYGIPVFGRLISGNRKAYTYLPESVAAFPSGKTFLDILSKTGMVQASQEILSGGIASIYLARK